MNNPKSILNYKNIGSFFINRKPVEAQENDVVAGVLWSDPVQKPGTANSSRGIGIFFGPDITKRFLGNFVHAFVHRHNLMITNIEYSSLLLFRICNR